MSVPPIDPTANVLLLVEAAVKRQDDLRDLEARHAREIADLRSQHQFQLDLKEAARIDANRQFDQLEVRNLAARREQDVEAQRQLVSTTAAALATSQASANAATNERLAALEKALYQGEGRGGGMKQFYGWIVGAIFLLISLWNTFKLH